MDLSTYLNILGELLSDILSNITTINSNGDCNISDLLNIDPNVNDKQLSDIINLLDNGFTIKLINKSNPTDIRFINYNGNQYLWLNDNVNHNTLLNIVTLPF